MKRRVFLAATVALAYCLAPSALPQELTTERVVSGLSSPVALVGHPTDPTILFVVQQRGRIRVIRDGVLLGVDFLNLSGVVSQGGFERGLLGLAFDPDYAANRRFYVNFTNTAGNTVISRFKRSVGNPLVADPGSRFDFRWGGPQGPRWIAQPFSNHNGGNLMFGPDGFLYIGLGDGGSGGDPGNRAQNPFTRLGKMLRIDVSVPDADPEGFAIPQDNPFVDGNPINALHEIWAFGLRNPWKYSFDDPALGGTGAMYIADVGQNRWEEIDYQHAGEGGLNYGWRRWEGNELFSGGTPLAYGPATFPIHVYFHSGGNCSVTGGFVYRGLELGCNTFGHYFFADWCTASIWSFKVIINKAGDPVRTEFTNRTAELAPGGGLFINSITGFGVDANGELYIVDQGGEIFRVVARRPLIFPVSFSILRGLLMSGELEDLLKCDDSRLVVRTAVFAPSSDPPVQIEVVGTSPTETPSELRFRFEGMASRILIERRISLYNYVTQSYEELHVGFAATSDEVIEIVVTTNPSRFVEPGTGQVKSLMTWKAAAFSFFTGWNVGLDQTIWTVTP